MLDLYDTDAKLLEKVQSGKGDPEIYNEDQTFLFIEGIFAGTEPETIYQHMHINKGWNEEEDRVGRNDLRKAKATQYSYFISQNRLEEVDEDAYLGFE